MRGMPSRVKWADWGLAAGLGVVMAVTLAFFMMAIPAPLFAILFDATGVSAFARVGQFGVTLAMAGGAGLFAAHFFHPPRKPEAKGAADDAYGPCADAGTGPDTDGTDDMRVQDIVEEAVLDLVEDMPVAMDGDEDAIALFIDLPAIRAAAKARIDTGPVHEMIRRIADEIGPGSLAPESPAPESLAPDKPDTPDKPVLQGRLTLPRRTATG